MKRFEVIELREVLASKELRAKHLSGNDLVSLAYLKAEMAKYFEVMSDAEQSLAEAHDIKRDEKGGYILTSKEVRDKFKEIQGVPFESKNLNFIESEIVTKFVTDTDIDTATTVIKYLAVKPKE